MQNKYRESANEYWKAFQAFQSLTHPERYHVLHGLTTTLRGDYFEVTDEDFANMTKIFEDKHEPRLFRMEAGYALGVMHYDRTERHKCEDAYHRVISIGEKKAKKLEEKSLRRNLRRNRFLLRAHSG